MTGYIKRIYFEEDGRVGEGEEGGREIINKSLIYNNSKDVTSIKFEIRITIFLAQKKKTKY